jgi:glutamate-ammonia-ligase adenylyltransferase
MTATPGRVAAVENLPDPRPLLLASGLSPETAAALLTPYGLADPKRADANLQAMAGEPRSRGLLAAVLAELLAGVAQTADPDQALNHWERYLQDGINRVHLFDYLGQSPRMLHLLCAIFGNSPFLAQTLIRDPLLVYWLAEEQVLTRRPSRAMLAAALGVMLRNVEAIDLKFDALRRFRRRELLRIGVRDLLRQADVRETTAALSDLACVLIQGAFETVSADLRRRHGIPTYRNRRGQLVEAGFAVIGMGKLGGGELNYSSDVDLIYVYATDDGETRPAAHSIPNEEFFEYLAREVTRALGEITHEGHVYRVDLRLRAEGSVGRLARPLAGYQEYYRRRGQGWERLALLKAWPVAGDPVVGQAFLRMVQPFIFAARQEGRGASLFREVRAIKEMIDGRIADRGQAARNVKLGTGGIREIEFIVQAIQAACGGRLAGIRDRNTLATLERFQEHGILTREEATRLSTAYCFLRDVEHKLQMVHDLQTHALPEAPEETARCAIRLGYGGGDRAASGRRLLADYRRHTRVVHALFRSLFYARQSSLHRAISKALNTQRAGQRPRHPALRRLRSGKAAT